MSDLIAPEEHHSLNQKQLYKDTRRFSQILFDEIPKYDTSILVIFTATCATIFFPISAWLVIPIILLVSLWCGFSKKNKVLPMKLPIELYPKVDYHNPLPGEDKKFDKAAGTILLGNIRRGKSEVWVTGKDLLTHMLLIGTTGAGKSEALVSLSSCTAFIMGGGILYIDAKAAIKLLYQFVGLAQIFGRIDDIRTINFTTSTLVAKGRHWERPSNTANSFAKGTSEDSVQTLTGMMPSSGGDNQYFLDKAIAIIRCLMPALVELRDLGVTNIYPSLIGEFISLKKFMELSRNEIIVNDVPYPGVKLSDRSVKPIKSFIESLPSYNPKLSAEKQPEEVGKQFGFAEGYFARTLASLAGTFGHIYETELPETDFSDVIVNSRIFINLIPAIGLAKEESTAFGKLILSSIRTAMKEALGEKGEGDYEDVIESLPIDLKIPTSITVDEYPAIAIEGFAITATQGRGLGMAVTFGGQDLAGFINASKEEADMIFGNTRLKVVMALEEPEQTFDRLKKLSGTMKVAENGGWEKSDDEINTFKSNVTATVKEIERISMRDFVKQREGQAHLFEKGNIHRMQLYFHGISDRKLKKIATNYRTNRMLKVKAPEPDTIEKLQMHIQRNKQIENDLLSGVNPKIGNLPILDLLAGTKGYNEDENWPWRLLNTLGLTSNPIEVPVSTPPLTPVKKQEAPKPSAEKIDSSVQTPEVGMNSGNLIIDPSEPYKNAMPSDIIETNKNLPNYSERQNDIDQKINTVLAKAEAEWIYNSVSDEDGISNARRIFNSMVKMDALAGLPTNKASTSAIGTIQEITEATVHPSSNITSKPEDVNALWGAINNIRED